MGEHHFAIDDGGLSLVGVHGRISRGKEEVPRLRQNFPGYAATGKGCIDLSNLSSKKLKNQSDVPVPLFPQPFSPGGIISCIFLM